MRHASFSVTVPRQSRHLACSGRVVGEGFIRTTAKVLPHGRPTSLRKRSSSIPRCYNVRFPTNPLYTVLRVWSTKTARYRLAKLSEESLKIVAADVQEPLCASADIGLLVREVGLRGECASGQPVSSPGLCVRSGRVRRACRVSIRRHSPLRALSAP